MTCILFKKTVLTGAKIPVEHSFRYDHALFSLSPHEIVPTVRLHSGRKVSVCLENQKAFYSEGQFVDEISSSTGMRKLEARIKGKLAHIEGRVLDLVTPGSNLYSHWLLDLLPKIKMVTDAGYDINRDFDRIIVNFYGGGFKKESFQLLGIESSKVWDYKTHPKFFVADELVTVTAPRARLFTPDWVTDFVNKLFSREKSYDMPSKVYISRSKGNSRRILNEALFVEHISSLGYKTYYCEDHSIATTAAVIRNATHIIAPHGAGLANIIFAKPKTKVFELFCAHLSPEFYKISLAKKLDYHAIQVPSAHGNMIDIANMDYANNREYYHSMNMLVDDFSKIAGC